MCSKVVVITQSEVCIAFASELGCIDYRATSFDPWPPGEGNYFSVRYVDEVGESHEVYCCNMRLENYMVLCELYPDLKITVNCLGMYVTDPRVGPEWKHQRWKEYEGIRA